MKAYLVLLAFVAVVLSQQVYDFGGFTYPFRDQYSTFETLDSQGNLVDYGFYMMKFGDSGLPSTGSSPYALVQYFNKTRAPLLPFEFLHLHFNPSGHGGGGGNWFVSHYDFHLFVKKPEFVRGIVCPSGHGPTCDYNPLFQNLPDPVYLPETGTWIYEDPVEQMGMHVGNQEALVTPFNSQPANLFGSFDGEMIFFEPMVSRFLLQAIEGSVSKTASYSFPRPQRHPAPGMYFDTMEITSLPAPSKLMKITFKDLYRAPEYYRDVPVYIGMVHTITGSPLTPFSPVSANKNCYVHSETTEFSEAGYEVTLPSPNNKIKVCCLRRYNKSGSQCIGGCGQVIATPRFEDDLSLKCFGECYERV